MKNFSFLLLLMLASCEIIYDAGTRMMVETQIRDRDGNPLENIAVDVVVQSNNMQETISSGKTDGNGNVLLIFPDPVDVEAEFTIYANPSISENASTEYQTRFMPEIRKLDFQQFKYTLSPVTLYKNTDLTTLSIIYDDSDPEFSGVIQIDLVGRDASEDLTPDNDTGIGYDMPSSITVVKNSEYILRYSLVNTAGQRSDFSVPIVVSDQPLDYTIIY